MSTQLQTGEVVDGYRVEDVISAGSTTTTYRAQHEQLGRNVALKVFHGEVFEADPQAREAARRDAVQAGRLEHPAIATVFTAGPVGEGLYVASALVTGRTLEEVVAAGEMTPARCAELVKILASALETAHAAGVCHRELRPLAITVDRWGHPVLRDFGVTRLSGRTGLATRMEFAETLRYAAPELILGRKATAASDVYGLAATAWFCLTGQDPFPALPVGELVALRAEAPAPRLADVPAVDRVLAAAMSPDPDERPSPTQLAERLEVAIEGLPREVRDSPSPIQPAASAPGTTAGSRVVDGPSARAPVAPADMTRVDRQRVVPQAPAPEAGGRSWSTVGAWVAALAACALLGFALGRAAAPGPPPLPRTGFAELVVRGLWNRGGPGVDAVELESPLVVSGDGRSASVGFLPVAGLPGDPLPASAFRGDAKPAPERVSAGGRTLIRYVVGDAVIFALPTSKGTLVAACRPSTATSECAALVASARLGGAKLVSPVPTREEAQRVAEALRALEVARVSGYAELAGRAEGRANAANRLGSAYREAAQALREAHSPTATTLAGPLAKSATAFEALASAIDRRSKSAYRGARADALAADRRVRRAILSLGRAGYRTAS